MHKFFILVLFVILPSLGFSQQESSPVQFFNNLKQHAGKAYEGTITEGGKEGDGFTGQRLVMHVRSCEDNCIRIPFFVGEDKSRTWVLTLENDRILLKHDHRHEDGTEDSLTMYGGLSTNTGNANMQMFPADQYTCDLIGHGAFNVWWITIDETTYTYNLHRVGTPRTFSVTFDLTKEIEAPSAPWGWND
ncbi:MAG: hypothetical protein R3Y51_00350 [Rikenellaceae bacterium]